MYDPLSYTRHTHSLLHCVALNEVGHQFSSFSPSKTPMCRSKTESRASLVLSLLAKVPHPSRHSSTSSCYVLVLVPPCPCRSCRSSCRFHGCRVCRGRLHPRNCFQVSMETDPRVAFERGWMETKMDTSFRVPGVPQKRPWEA